MVNEPTYEELQQKVRELEQKAEKLRDVEIELKEIEYRAQQYFSLPGIIFLVLDTEGCIIQLNDNGLKILGYQRRELIGKNWFTTCLPDRFQKNILEVYHQLMRGEIRHADHNENLILRKDGSERLIAWNNNIIRNRIGEIIGTISSGEDITDKRNAENRLKETYGIINKSPAVAFLWKNLSGWPVEFVSENVVKLFGYTAFDFISGKVSYVDVIHSDDLERVADEVANFSSEKGRENFFHEPYRIITKENKVKWLEDQTFIRRNKNGIITHYQGIVLDITERKKADEILVQERNKLQKAFEKIKTLSGMLPICANCKKIRDDKGYWNKIECYFREHSEVEFSHSICPECSEKLYPDLK